MSDTFSLIDPATGQLIEYQAAPICGFWKRIVALIIDSMILGIIGCILGFIFSKQFVLLGFYGRVIGLVITLVYFGILNSRIGNGQSFGKRLLKIKVVNKNRESISLYQSLLRTLILIVPFFLNGLVFPPIFALKNRLLPVILQVLVFGIGGSIIYLYLFNKNSRQSVHDLILKTYVVRSDLEGPVYTEQVYKLHYLALGVFILLIIVFPFVIHLAPQEKIDRVMLLENQIIESNNIINAIISYGTINHAGKSSPFVAIAVFTKDRNNIKDLVRNTVKVILNDSYCQNKSYINVVINYGYDIGIWSYYQCKWYWHTPKEWREELKI